MITSLTADIPIPLLVGTHLLALVLGAWMGKRISERTIPNLFNSQEVKMSDTAKPPHYRGPTPGALALIFLLAVAMLVGFGFQQNAFQKQVHERDACYEEWGRELIEVTTNARGATVALDRAREVRDNAVDSIVLVFIGLRSKPPTAVIKDLNQVLLQFASAKANLDKVSERVQHTRASNPPPKLNCD